MKASALITALIFVVVGSIIVGGYLAYVSRESYLSHRLGDSIKALYLAEAGLERALLQAHDDWYGADEEDPAEIFKLNSIDETKLGGGSYQVSENWVSPNIRKKITATGIYGDETRIVNQDVYLDPEVNFYDQVIASTGSQGGKITGNSRIMGSVYILGEEPFVDTNENSLYDAGEPFIDNNGSGDWGPYLSSGDYAFRMGGNSELGNNYGYMPSDLKSRVSSIYDSEDGWDTLDAQLLVKYGKISLESNSAMIGAPDDPDDGLKNFMDSVIVPDGVDIFSGAMYTDQYFTGIDKRLLFKNTVRMPSIKDAYTDTATGTFYPSPADPYNSDTRGGYEQYLYNVANDAADPERGVYIDGDLTITPTSSFSYGNVSDPNKSGIAMDGSGNLTVNGLIYVNGALSFNTSPGKDDIYYSGRGSFYVRGYRDSDLTNDVVVNVNILTQDVYKGAFPNSSLGIMSRENMLFAGANNHVCGAFYAQGTVTMTKQYEIAGTVISTNFDMTDNVPSIYQVPALADNQPPYMINALFPSLGPLPEDWYESYNK